jgi:hypothetical protein
MSMEGVPFNKWYWSNWTSTGEKMNPDLNLTPCIKLAQNGSRAN